MKISSPIRFFVVLVFGASPFFPISAYAACPAGTIDTGSQCVPKTAATSNCPAGTIDTGSQCMPSSNNNASPVLGNSATPTAGNGKAAPTHPCAPTDDDIANSSVSQMLSNSNCKPGKVIDSTKGYKIEDGARQKVVDIANQIILVGSLLSVGAIVYAAILYIIAAGDDERIKKAKGSLKFGIIGFVMMLISFPLVNAIIKLFYTASGA